MPMVLLCAGLFAAESTFAGGGPENVVVVVNGDSWASKAVANEFVRLRRIPAGNVVYLADVPDFETVDVETFRQRILRPVLQAIADRGLQTQIDYVVYSSDLPWAVNATSDLDGKSVHRAFTPIGSLNGMTYLYQRVLAGGAGYLQLDSNRYLRRPMAELKKDPVTAEDRARFVQAFQLVREQKWGEAETLLENLAKKYPAEAGLHYNLACCLARQEKLAAATAALAKAVEAGWSDRRHAEGDADLKPLTGRDDFQHLLAKMDENSRATFEVQPTRGFRSRYQWNARGDTVPTGERYLLSTMLAVTSGRGNSAAEAVAALRRSAAADYSRPAGTIYYLVNGDVRSKTRDRAFPSAAAQLKTLGVKADVIDGVLPPGKDDVQGAMIGAAAFDWQASNSRILPGAICEHLTSFGGVMGEKSGQTPLTEFIRHGAAGASGTVTEPLAIAAKFPSAFLHVHYAGGCSLAEAFYQAVSGPYQLLIVGDPLCQPWAQRREVTADGLKAGAEVSGAIVITPAANDIEGVPRPVDRFELYLDGRLSDTCRPEEQFRLDTSTIADGYHEVRVVAIDATPVETQHRLVVPLVVNNRGRRVTLAAPGGEQVRWDQPVVVDASAAGADVIGIFHNGRRLATIERDRGAAELLPRDLGRGPVSISAVATIDGMEVRSAPMELTVPPPDPLPALAEPVGLVAGLLLKPGEREAVVVDQTTKRTWLSDHGLKPGEQFRLTALFEADHEDLYQFQLRSNGAVELKIDDKRLFQQAAIADGGAQWRFVPAALKAGFHRFELIGTAAEKPTLEIRFGRRGTQSVDAGGFRHLPPE
jgi:hypothetical protein